MTTGRQGPSLNRRTVVAGLGAGLAAGTFWLIGAKARAADALVQETLDDRLTDRPVAGGDRLRLDLPSSFDYGNTVPLDISIDSPMTPGDHIRRLDVFAEGNPFPKVFTCHFTPLSGRAHLSTRIRLNEGLQEVVALAEASDGTLSIARKTVQVAIGGCSEEAGVAAAAPMPTPVPRLRLPKTAAPGEIVDVRTMISHRMETGLRIDGAGEVIPRHIIHRMTCHRDGALVFAADLSPAIAANAYLAFSMVNRAPGDLAFAWHEDGGAVYHASSSLPAV